MVKLAAMTTRAGYHNSITYGGDSDRRAAPIWGEAFLPSRRGAFHL